MLCSCVASHDDKYSVRNVWNQVSEFYSHMSNDTDKLLHKRSEQRVRLLYDYMYAILTQDIKKDPHMKQLVKSIEQKLKSDQMVPRVAAQLIIQQYQQNQLPKQSAK